MLIKNETRTEIEKKKLSKVATSSGNNRTNFGFFFGLFFMKEPTEKNTLKILSSNFCVDAAINGAQCRTALPCMRRMQSMDPTAGFAECFFSCFFSVFFYLLFFWFLHFGAAVFGVHASRMICFKAHKAKQKFVYFVSRCLTHFWPFSTSPTQIYLC